MMKLLFPIVLFFCLAVETPAADLRCQGDLMTPGTIITKVRRKCGDPVWEDRVGEITVRSGDGKERLLYITQLTYEFSGGYYVLTFEGGELKRTEYFQY